METFATPGLAIVDAQTPEQIVEVRSLFLEYAQSLGFSLCFQSFDDELAGLPGDYSPPGGCLLLALYDGAAAGCAALHSMGAAVGEMKRLYVRPQFRGKAIGRILAEQIVARARAAGHQRLRLDTVEPNMKKAVALYRQMGFTEIPPYRANPIAGAMYMELELSGS